MVSQSAPSTFDNELLTKNTSNKGAKCSTLQENLVLSSQTRDFWHLYSNNMFWSVQHEPKNGNVARIWLELWQGFRSLPSNKEADFTHSGGAPAARRKWRHDLQLEPPKPCAHFSDDARKQSKLPQINVACVLTLTNVLTSANNALTPKKLLTTFDFV